MSTAKNPPVKGGFSAVVCTGLEPVFRNLNRRDSPLGSSLVSVEKAADEISATGGPRRLSPVDVSHLGSPGSMSGAEHNKIQDHR